MGLSGRASRADPRTWINAARHLFSPAHRRRRRAIALLEASQLFDRAWYLDHYGDVAGSGIDPARHFLEFGWQEGRDPGPHFSTNAYLRANADVAALGINPLLHYVEHGHAEGRGAPGQASPALVKRAPVPVGPAAPCATFPLDQEAPPPWHSAGLARGDGPALIVQSRLVGRYRDARGQRSIEAALARLKALTEDGAVTAEAVETPPLRLVDAWHGGLGRLRTRWALDGAGPLVVRTVQQRDGAPMLLGEALVSTPLDVVDAYCPSPFAPLLFLFATAEGELVGSRLLAFPSLCRGGVHYPEMLALAEAARGENRESDCALVSDRLLEALAALRAGAAPLLESIEVDLAGGDGTQPLLQPEFRRWLCEVARIALEPMEGAKGRSEAFLADAVRLGGDGSRAAGEAKLLLASDMVPAIAALVAAGTGAAIGDRAMVPFIAASPDPARPSALLSAPSNWSVGGLAGMAPAYPRLDPVGTGHGGEAGEGPSQLPVAALRMPRPKPLGEAELLVPVANRAALSKAPSESIGWLSWPAEASDDQLLETLESLALQDGAAARLRFIGAPPPRAAALAARLFGDVRVAADVEAALESLGGGLVGFIAPGIVLHDGRAATVMAAALDDPAVETASVVLVAMDRRGKGWVVTPADAGQIADGEAAPGAIDCDPAFALDLWRSAWPVARPPRDLWMTRQSTLSGWLSGGPAVGHHLCTSLVTASYGGARPSGAAPLVPPQSRQMLRRQVLAG